MFKIKKEQIRYAGLSVLGLPEGTIVKVVNSGGYDNNGILVRTDNNKKPFKQLVEVKDSLRKGQYWRGDLAEYEFEVLKDKKESDYYL